MLAKKFKGYMYRYVNVKDQQKKTSKTLSKFLKIGKKPNKRQSSFLGFTRKKSRNEEINYY